ncbi:DUF2852 domain-containing protein [Rubellimicrobium aerolatum]|uniref:DUF2852 domain-containing protein n=1 Tax=Rubellimicrobium aerolatum TaxID=490979 RepID=A0ABW0SEE2_9RHOB|nr:DUF2852 domain-containing protein [Rubellimicrobium aerolatum]MBP1805664.1 hypothetical protein [Rubellimicrobium aerolatum]
MTATDTSPRPPLSWPARACDALDDRGPLAWGLATLATFVVIWPLGLALLAWALWTRRLLPRTWPATRSRPATGNAAFAAHRAEALDRLAAEQAAFEEFQRSRRATEDRAEFDRFLAERAARPDAPQP